MRKADGNVINMARLSPIYDDDTFLVSYPRSGNTWMRYLIANIQQPDREWNLSNISEIVPDIYEHDVSDYGRPRIMKSHEQYTEDYPKVLYMFRDGRDVSVSYYHLYKTAYGFEGPFSEFVKEMLAGNVAFGKWQDHVDSWLFRPHAARILSVKYELLCEKTIEVMRNVASFLELSVHDSVIEEAVRRCSFERQKRDVERYSPHYEKGFRCGVKGGPGKWKEVFDQGMNETFWSVAGAVMQRLGYGKDG